MNGQFDLKKTLMRSLPDFKIHGEGVIISKDGKIKRDKSAVDNQPKLNSQTKGEQNGSNSSGSSQKRSL